MASVAYAQWIAAGQPYTPARPISDFVNVLRGKGFTVFHKGDTSHMTAVPPEDHTPFSATGWPIPSTRWIGHALDIMPTGAPVPLPDFARQIIRDKDSHVHGTGWIKYMNWTDETNVCRHESWQNSTGTRVTTLSIDKGHIHISARSDMDNSTEVSDSGYYPGGSDMSFGTAEEYELHAINYRADGIASGKKLITVPTFVDSAGNTHPPLSNTNQVAVNVEAILKAVSPDALAAALASALAAHPEIVDAIASAVVRQIGAFPTADDIARAVGALTWRTTVGA